MITPTCPRAGAPRFVRAPHSSTCRALSAGRGPRAACHPSDLLAPHALSLLVVTALRLAWGPPPSLSPSASVPALGATFLS